MYNALKTCAGWLVLTLMLAGCTDTTTPKPRGFFRVELPEKSYVLVETPCGVQFDVPNYSKLEIVKKNNVGDSCWFNISFPRFNARLHCTYVPIENNFDLLIRDSYHFAAKHEMKASALKRTIIDKPEDKVYGILYDIEGDAASQLQLFLSDSTDHFFRGSMYFFNPPNPDSIAPVLNFIREDIVRMTNTFKWSN